MVPQLTYMIFCTMRTGMSTDLVPSRNYYGNGEIRYGDSGVDLTEFQLFDIELNSPLDYSRKQVLAWLHEHLGVLPTQHHFRISMLVPKKRENGWRWELYEGSNTKKWHFLVLQARCRILTLQMKHNNT